MIAVQMVERFTDSLQTASNGADYKCGDRHKMRLALHAVRGVKLAEWIGS